METNLIAVGSGASLLAGLATAFGAIPVLLLRRPSERLQDTLLGFSAGVMLAASFFSLIVPALDHVEAATGSRTAAGFVVAAAILLGSGLLGAANHFLPHEHFVSGRSGQNPAAFRRIWLFVIAITIHNLPEGLAVGVGFGGGDFAAATGLAIGIGLQNMPEGLAVATALVSVGYRAGYAFLVAAATGLVEPIGGTAGVLAVSAFEPLLPWGLGFAAGAMLFVISNEIIPETHRKGHEGPATAGLMAGLAVMMLLDVSLT